MKNHFSSKTNKARQALTVMIVLLNRYQGKKEEQQERLKVFDELINYTIKVEIELNESEQKYSELIMELGRLRSLNKELAQLHYISEKVHEKGVKMVVDESIERFRGRLLEISK